MLHTIAVILFLAICVTSFISTKWSVSLFIVHKIFLSVAYVTIGSFVFPSNYLALLIFVGYIIKNIRRREHFCFVPVYYYIVYFLICACLSIFSWDISLCVSIIKSDFISIVLIPFVIINVAKFDEKSWAFIKKVVLLSIALTVVYGLFLIPLKGVNPYTIELKKIVGGTGFSEKWLMEEGRIFGRITGTFTHPMYYANYLLYSLIYVLYLYFEKKDQVKKILVVVLFFCLMTCGVRSGVMALMGVFAYFCLTMKKRKVFLYVGIASCSALLCFWLFPNFFDYVISPFVSDGNGYTQGSSFSMRFAQISKSFDAISGRELSGLGYGWTTWYLQQKGNHPYLLAFESLILKIVCEGGLVGTLLFVWLYMKLYGSKIRMSLNELFCKLLITAYICFTLFTGDYLYSVYFLLFYSLVYGDYINALYKDRRLG